MEITMLPEVCISHRISLTSPRDACRSSLVSSRFRSAVNSDVVWSKFLPHDYHQVLSNSDLASSMNSLSKKQLYFHLYHHPVLVDNGKMSFAIDKESGKKCYMISSRRLPIVCESTATYWLRKSLQAESRFSEVAELTYVSWLSLKGRIETNILSPKTTYAAYFVYKLKESSSAFMERQVELGVYFEGEEKAHGASEREVFLFPSRDQLELCRDREDGWMEVEMGDFFNYGGEEHGVVVFSLMHIHNDTCRLGLIVEGVELRPKAGT
ncbi:hypothetical protein FEM48_Zijuj07G0070900 [Ziziphus jujuba var. spinosa]|uniref:F-box domain-containing protein n=1 Tax=Ziziphus jujuba var. spinosa TaxID=714518 RepID=A0A978V369_ZIZJJ|nr:hypothetical protein FEM48_Zijuj07G0070900 [Ziziphus jujuba var. spinosa]